ncbi:MAG: 7TM diverse intracellular signaling domain-containing protein [Bacteroidota bacterium]
MNYLLHIFFLIFLPFSLMAQGDNSLKTLHAKGYRTNEILNANRVKFYLDTTKTLDFTDVQKQLSDFAPAQGEIPNFSNTEANVWGAFRIQSPTSQQLFLQVSTPLLDSLEVYLPTQDSSYQKVILGAKLPFSARLVEVTDFVIPLSNPDTSKVQTYFFRVRSEFPVELPMRVMSAEKLAEYTQHSSVLYGIYFGILLVMMAYNFFLFFSTKDRLYLLYSIYVFFLFILYSNFKGYVFKYVWGDLPILNRYVVLLVSGVTSFALLFALRFLEIRKRFTKIYWAGLIFIGLNALVALLNLFGLYSEVTVPSQLLSLLLPVYLLFASIYAYKHGVKNARFFILAWATFMVGIAVFILQILTVIPSTFFTMHASYFGSAIEVTLLSFALADRINLYKREKEQAQKTNQRLIEEQNQELERKIKAATLSLQANNDELNATNEELNSANDQLSIYNKEIRSINSELGTTVETIKEQRRIIAKKNQSITDSLRYAQTIQQAVLPFNERMEKLLGEYFVIYSPKDIVSGDFYWITSLDDKVYVAVADCTGHGVPGAFMSMIGSAALDALVDRNRLSDPAEILSELHKIITKSLHQKDKANTDGLEIGLCVLDCRTETSCRIRFAGAKRPLYYYKSDTKEICELKGTRESIGGQATNRVRRPFIIHEMTLYKDDCLYLPTDGFSDQHNAKNENRLA